MTTAKKANLILDGQSTGLTIVERAPWEDLDFVFDAIFNLFHGEGLDEDESPSDKFMAHWTLLLATAGWTEKEFWVEAEARRNAAKAEGACPDCGEPMDDDNDESLELPPTGVKHTDHKAN